MERVLRLGHELSTVCALIAVPFRLLTLRSTIAGSRTIKNCIRSR
jgi:hypothetical protein